MELETLFHCLFFYLLLPGMQYFHLECLCDFHFEFIHFFFDFLNHLKEKGVVFMI